jgi:ABC-2 type transport system permease protein
MIRLFKDLYSYRELLKNNIKKEIRGKYKGAWLGVLWSYLNPLLMLVVYSLVFSTIMKIEIPNYTMFLFTALIPWTFFTSTISQGSFSIISNGNILKKVFFPREIIPISVVTSNCINFLISFVIMFVFIAISGLGFSVYLIFLPLIILIQYILLLGIILITSSITVYFRDLEHIINVLLMLLFYGTPIVYSMEMVPDNMKGLLLLNPMTSIVNVYRDVLFYQRMPDFFYTMIMLVISILILVSGIYIFNRLQRNFAEEL